MCSRRFIASDYIFNCLQKVIDDSMDLVGIDVKRMIEQLDTVMKPWNAGVTAMLLMAVSVSAQVSPSIRADLAPTGRLRVGINYGNPVLAQGGPAAGDLRGIAVDLGRELGRRIGVP